jgi:pimeloyl-ACP methyl ester carboxylesterase
MRKLKYLVLIALFVTAMAGCSAKNDNEDAAGDNITSEDGIDPAAENTTPVPTDTENQPEDSVTDAPADDTSQTSSQDAQGSVMPVEIQSEAIAKNVIGDKSTRKIYVYLPPSYDGSDKAYPVVYFLHGYSDSCVSFMNSYQPKLDELFKNGEKEFILVALDGNNKTGGSFYVNSAAGGNWEDFVVNEIVAYMDTNYRTIPNSESRGISGYSMGGFGALNLSLKHPDIFSSTLVFCPGVFAENDLDAVLSSWKGTPDISRSYAQAFSPDVNNTEDYGNIIQASDIEAQNTVWQDWMNGFSNWDQKLDDYLALDKPLKAIEITYSDSDYYKWIPRGCSDLLGLMEERDINYLSDTFTGGHIVPWDAIEKYFVPFFGENLTY